MIQEIWELRVSVFVSSIFFLLHQIKQPITASDTIELQWTNSLLRNMLCFDNWHCSRRGSECKPDKDRLSRTKGGRAVKLRYLRGFTVTCNNLTLFLEIDGIKIDGKLWNSGICNRIGTELVCWDVRCVFLVACVATVLLASSSKLVTCRIHLPRLHLDCGVWSFCFWIHLPTHARLHRHINKHSKHSYVQSHSQICCISSDLKLLHEDSSMQNGLAFFQTHMQPHTQVHTLKYLYRHTAFLILDALAYTPGDLWGWLPLVLCVSLTWYYLVSKPQLSTETERWSGDGGKERGWQIEGKGVVRK